MADEKKPWWTTLRIMIVGTFSVLSIGTAYYLKAERTQDSNVSTHDDIENRIYPDVQTLQKAMAHDNEVPTDVENFKREVRLIEQGDSLLLYQNEINKNLKVIDSFYAFERNKKIDDSITEIKKQESRDSRQKDIEDIKTENQNIGNMLRAMQRTLDTMN